MENSLYEDSSLVPIVKVIDFGLCAEIKGGDTSRAFVGTVLYTAPEVSTYSSKCQVISRVGRVNGNLKRSLNVGV